MLTNIEQRSTNPMFQREERTSVALDCEVRQGRHTWKKTRLEDLSQNGFKVAWFPNCRPGLPLRIRIAGLELLNAHVKWQDERTAGCMFDTPLHIAVYDHIVAQTRKG